MSFPSCLPSLSPQTSPIVSTFLVVEATLSLATSAGYDAFNQNFDAAVLYGNGTINWDATYAFAYTALGELTKIGKPVTQAFYRLNDTKVYTYFEGCSDGGREAMSQVQRWGEEYDGVVAGAPAFRFAQQQVSSGCTKCM
jgi:tannase